MYLILSVFILFTGCNEEEVKQQENSLIGTWQLVERFDGGSPVPIQIIEEGEILVFGEDSSYSNNSYQCNGTYIINNSIIEISAQCVTQDLIKFSYSFENNALKLTGSPSTCDEGCYDKYIKIASE